MFISVIPYNYGYYMTFLNLFSNVYFCYSLQLWILHDFPEFKQQCLFLLFSMVILVHRHSIHWFIWSDIGGGRVIGFGQQKTCEKLFKFQDRYLIGLGLELWCVTSLSTIFQYIVVSFNGGGNCSTRRKPNVII